MRCIRLSERLLQVGEGFPQDLAGERVGDLVVGESGHDGTVRVLSRWCWWRKAETSIRFRKRAWSRRVRIQLEGKLSRSAKGMTTGAARGAAARSSAGG